MNFNPPRRPAEGTEEPPKHVIEEYRHRKQEVTCTCGWHGSTATPLGGKSAWDLHKAEFRTSRP